MKNRLLILTTVITLVLLFSGTRVNSAQAALPNPNAILPIPPSGTAKYSQGSHLSGFKMGYITNPGQNKSSIDLGYSGTVVAPISGTLAIAVNCGDHQIAFIRGKRGTDGYGWAVGLTHIYVNTGVRNREVIQGQVIGKTVPPPPYPGKGCGYGSGSHIHYTLMRWKMASNGPVYTEQSITNTYIAQYIVKDTYLDGSRNDIPKGAKIEDVVKITSVHSKKIIEGRDTGVVRTMSFFAGNLKQTWNMIAAGDGYFYFRNRQYGKCITIKGASLDNGAKTILAACGNNDHQKFMRYSVSSAYALLVKHSGKAIDIPTDWGVPGSGTGDGIQLQQWDPFYGTNQQWTISKP